MVGADETSETIELVRLGLVVILATRCLQIRRGFQQWERLAFPVRVAIVVGDRQSERRASTPRSVRNFLRAHESLTTSHGTSMWLPRSSLLRHLFLNALIELSSPTVIGKVEFCGGSRLASVFTCC